MEGYPSVREIAMPVFVRALEAGHDRNEAGALASTLNIIGAHGYKMRNLKSRPLKGLAWNYYFYLEAEGDIHTRDGKDMLQELSALCADLKLVGTFRDDHR